MSSIQSQLIRKDFDINRLPLLGYASLAVIALVLIGIGTNPTFLVGSILLISVVVTIGIQLIFVTVIHERSHQTLPMIMSLPITFMQYTKAKIAINLGGFLVPWLAIVATVAFLFLTRDSLPAGMLPFSTIILLELFMANVIMLTVAMVTESEAWTLVVMTTFNVCISLFIFLIRSIPGIGDHMFGETPVWNATAITTMAIEILIMLACIALIFYVQSRKTDFL